jgi:hypothetical protein
VKTPVPIRRETAVQTPAATPARDTDETPFEPSVQSYVTLAPLRGGGMTRRRPTGDGEVHGFVPLAELPTYWLAEAEHIRPYAPAAAIAWERAASELERALAEQGAEALTLNVAATESGLSVEHLARLVRTQKIPNAGKHRAPRILRRDLPRKAQRSIVGQLEVGYDVAADARALASRRHGGAHGATE